MQVVLKQVWVELLRMRRGVENLAHSFLSILRKGTVHR